MKKIYLLFVITAFFSITIIPQEKDYWVNAEPGTVKIFSISFKNELNGNAVSAEGDLLITVDGGESWKFKSSNYHVIAESKEKYLWEADIYCSVMKTTDSGETWFPYKKEFQEHFCGVYLKDRNTGYNIASEFLNKVAAKIFSCYENHKLNLLIDTPQQCTEYYSNGSEGWALGWCVKNLKHYPDMK